MKTLHDGRHYLSKEGFHDRYQMKMTNLKHKISLKDSLGLDGLFFGQKTRFNQVQWAALFSNVINQFYSSLNICTIVYFCT